MTTTEEAIDIIKRGAQTNSASVIKAVLQAGQRWKPAGFDAQQDRRRQHYTGHGAVHIRRRLVNSFPKTGARIPIWPYNWAKLKAQVAACVYDYAPKRWLVDASGKELAPEDERAVHFASLVELSGLDNAMAECERRAQWCGVGIIVIRPRPQIVDGVRVLVPAIDHYWASDVVVVPNTDAPGDVELSHAVALKIAGPDGPSSAGDAHWELWARGEDGAWYVSQVSDAGDVVAGGLSGERYAGARLPILFYRARPAECGPWPVMGLDDVEVLEALSADISDAARTESMQGHSSYVYVGTRNKKDQMTFSPESIEQIGPDERVDVITPSPAIVERRDSIRSRLQMMAIVNAQSPTAYMQDGRTQESGVARLIANEPQDKARAEQLKTAALFELTLGAAFVDVADTFCPGPTIAPAKAKFAPTPRPAYEAEGDKLQRARDLRDMGMISDAEAAVMLGLAANMQDAIGKGYSEARTSSTDMQSVVPAWQAPRDEPSPINATATVDAAATGIDVAATALNGAQVTALVEITQQVAMGALPKPAAQAIIAAAFPTLTPQQVNAIVSPLDAGSVAPKV